MTAFWSKFRSPCSERRKIGAASCYASLKAVSYELFRRNRPLDAWRNSRTDLFIISEFFFLQQKERFKYRLRGKLFLALRKVLFESRSFVVFTWKKGKVKKGRMLLKRILWNWWQVNMKDTVHQSLYLHCVHELLNLNWWTEFYYGLRNRVDAYFDIRTSIT